MNKDQLRFLLSGILFGFLVGYVIAFAVHEPRVKDRAAPVPAAGNLGMAPGSGGIGGPAPQSAPPGQAPGSEEVMNRVFEQIAALREAIEKNPEDADALIRLANFFHDAGRFDQAVEYYGRGLAVRPDDVNARTDMGICLRELGRVDEAIEQFRTSLTHDPEHWQTWLNLGIVSLYDKNDSATAAEAFAKVEQFNPGFEEIHRLKEAARTAAAGGSQDPS